MILHSEPSLDALSLRSDVISSLKILSPHVECDGQEGEAEEGTDDGEEWDRCPPPPQLDQIAFSGHLICTAAPWIPVGLGAIPVQT